MQTQTPDQPNRQPNQSNVLILHSMFPVPNGSYNPQRKVTRVVSTLAFGQRQNDTVELDLVNGCRPFRTNAMEMTAMTSGSTDQFTVTFEYRPGHNVIATGYHQNGVALLERLKADMRQIREYEKAMDAWVKEVAAAKQEGREPEGSSPIEEFDPVVSYNLLGYGRMAINPGSGQAIDQLRNGSGQGRNPSGNRDSLELVAVEAVRRSGDVEVAFDSLPNSTGAQQGGGQNSGKSQIDSFLDS